MIILYFKIGYCHDDNSNLLVSHCWNSHIFNIAHISWQCVQACIQFRHKPALMETGVFTTKYVVDLNIEAPLFLSQ